MKYLKELQAKKVFTLYDVEELTKNENTAKSLLQSYKNAGYICSVRKNLYAALDLASGATIATRYEIATGVSSSAYVSHHSALEFHGVANQVFFEVTVAAKENIRSFNYDGIRYMPIKSDYYDGVIAPVNSPSVRVTNIERTVVDCMMDIDLAGGLEELLECIYLIPQLNEELLLQYLAGYNKKKLWQAAGFILQTYNDIFMLSNNFFDECKHNMGKRKNYLGDTADMRYYPEWKLYAPKDIFSFLKEGEDKLV